MSASVCISAISGYVITSLQPLCHSIGLNSWRDAILSFITFTSIHISLDNSTISASSWGRNSCNGGSRYLMVHGNHSIALSIPKKSDFWNGSNFANAFCLHCTSSESIISLTAFILSSAKNICSVLHNHIHSAQKLLALTASSGVSAFVLIHSFLYLSDRVMMVWKSPLNSGSIAVNAQAKTSQVDQSNVIISHSLKVFHFTIIVLFASFIAISEHHETQHFPIHLATTAAWDVIHHLAVNIPWDATIHTISSGDVSTLTSITFFQFSFRSCAVWALNTICHIAAHGDAGNHLVKSSAVFFAAGSICLCNSASNCSGCTLSKAAFSSINHSVTISTAIFTAAAAVLFPFLVCRIYNFHSWIVNSISCISL